MNKTQKNDKILKLIAIILGSVATLHNLSGHIVEFVAPETYGASGVTGGFSSIWIGLLAIFSALVMLVALFFARSKPKIAGYLIIFGAFGCSAISFSVAYMVAFVLSVVTGFIWFSVKK